MRGILRWAWLLASSLAIMQVAADQYTRVFQLELLAYPQTPDEGAGDPQAFMKGFLERAGVNFEASDRPTFFFNERTKSLHVKGNSNDLGLIEKAVENLKKDGPMVRIAVTFAEIDETAKVNLDRLLGCAASCASDPTYSTIIAQMQREAPGEASETNQTPSVYVLTEAQLKTVMKELERRPGVDLMTAPATTTLSGRQARIAVESEEPVIIPPFHAPSDEAKKALRLNAE
jgi:hypothetical protein